MIYPAQVHIDSYLPNGKQVKDLQVGDLIPCWDPTTGLSRPLWVKIENLWFTAAECSVLVTEDGSSLIQANNHPDHPDMLGELVLTYDLKWTKVVSVIPIGKQPVLKLDLGGMAPFVGDEPNQTFAAYMIRHDT